MRIGFNPYCYSTPNFNGRIDKVINTLKTTIIDVKQMRITIDEAIKIYEKLGYKITKKPGSHITVKYPKGIEFSLKIPHGGEKRFIHPDAVKTLQCAVVGDEKHLVHSLHYHRK